MTEQRAQTLKELLACNFLGVVVSSFVVLLILTLEFCQGSFMNDNLSVFLLLVFFVWVFEGLLFGFRFSLVLVIQHLYQREQATLLEQAREIDAGPSEAGREEHDSLLGDR